MSVTREHPLLTVPLLTITMLTLGACTGGGTVQAASGTALDQGWTEGDRSWWYDVPQGSRLIPKAWLEALEQPGGTGMFLDPEHVRGFRYLPRDGATAATPSLPVGFVVDEQSDDSLSLTKLRWKPGQGDREPWVGLNCSACHTAEMTYQGTTLRVQGAPTLADFQGFVEELYRSLRETRATEARWDRFAGRVLAGGDTAEGRRLLAGAADSLLEWYGRSERQNGQDGTGLRYGFARLDAVGHIMNKVALVVEAPDQAPWPADAPVSYPHLWNAPQHDKVQWNGIAKNDKSPITIWGQETDFGALGRNAGEVIGVFADVEVDSFPANGFRSSVRVRELIEIERALGRLESPAWPEAVLGKIDTDMVSLGERLFQEHECGTCHLPLGRDDLKTGIEAKMSLLQEAGTDIWMACNAWAYRAESGNLEGVPQNILAGPPIEKTDTGARLLTATVVGTLIGEADSLAKSLARDVFTSPRRARLARAPNARLAPEAGFPDDPRKRGFAQECVAAAAGGESLLAYKARPLNGIWATAPYLHNGSVPTLYDLLLPSDMRPLTARADAPVPPGPHRPSSFFVGTREYDPVKVGYRTERSADNTFEFRTRGAEGREILGNSNAGHDYGTSGLTHDERTALVEYLKSL